MIRSLIALLAAASLGSGPALGLREAAPAAGAWRPRAAPAGRGAGALLNSPEEIPLWDQGAPGALGRRTPTSRR